MRNMSCHAPKPVQQSGPERRIGSYGALQAQPAIGMADIAQPFAQHQRRRIRLQHALRTPAACVLLGRSAGLRPRPWRALQSEAPAQDGLAGPHPAPARRPRPDRRVRPGRPETADRHQAPARSRRKKPILIAWRVKRPETARSEPVFRWNRPAFLPHAARSGRVRNKTVQRGSRFPRPSPDRRLPPRPVGAKSPERYRPTLRREVSSMPSAAASPKSAPSGHCQDRPLRWPSAGPARAGCHKVRASLHPRSAHGRAPDSPGRWHQAAGAGSTALHPCQGKSLRHRIKSRHRGGVTGHCGNRRAAGRHGRRVGRKHGFSLCSGQNSVCYRQSRF